MYPTLRTAVAAASLVLGMSTAQAGLVGLDFETSSTGLDFSSANPTLVTPEGTVTVSAPTTCNPPGTYVIDPANGNILNAGHVLCANSSGGANFLTLTFSFDVDSLSFIWGDQGGGSFQGDALDIGGNVIASVSSSTSGATLTLDAAAGIRGLRFRNPVASFSVIDDLTLNTGTVPEPTSLLLAGLALVAVGRVRRTRRG